MENKNRALFFVKMRGTGTTHVTNDIAVRSVTIEILKSKFRFKRHVCQNVG